MERKPFQLTAEQYARLTMPLDGNRVGKNPKGYSHLEAWDVRRWLIRVFGFGAFDIETVELAVVREIEIPPSQPNGKSRWTVVYRAQVRLTIWDQFGGHVVFEDGACGDSTNQPALGDCHDNAAKTALSQALKRCAVNLGDCFGLGLYNNGATAPVVQRSLVFPEMPAALGPESVLPTDDAPVLPEPGTTAAEPVDGHHAPPPAAPAPAAAEPVAAPDANNVRDWALQPDRTAEGIRKAAAKLLAEHPTVAATRITNEHGDQEQLSVLLARRAKELTPAAEPAPTEDAQAERRRKRMFALFNELGFTGDINRDNRHKVMGHTLNREVTSTKDLSLADIEAVIDVLEQRKRDQRQQARQAVPA